MLRILTVGARKVLQVLGVLGGGNLGNEGIHGSR
jgi:hypothetical protein